MSQTSAQLRQDALAIWQAGVNAVDSRRLVQDNVRVAGESLFVADEQISLTGVKRIVVVGTGKAGAGMAEGVELALGSKLIADKHLTGWLNVPADCVRPLARITLHAARPAGVNEPTPAGVEGAQRILELVESLTADDLCLCLLSGGGSALLPAPVVGITLADKQAITQHLSGRGANIEELNTVRKQLSRIKGGGLARACRAGRLITLIISDVMGDPLDVIASGPTVTDTSSAQDALDVLHRFDARTAGVSPTVFDYLQQRAQASNERHHSGPCQASNHVIGNIAVAVDAAGLEAERRGYSHAMTTATTLEGQAEEVGRHLARMALSMRREAGPDCLITGGEPVVQLVPPAERGLGGRNQQLVLAALSYLLERGDSADTGNTNPLSNIALLSGGTDGEDGPTDAAGAVIDAEVFAAMRQHSLSPNDFLQRNDAYHFFQPLNSLIHTGPTHTNVCDGRVVTVRRK